MQDKRILDLEDKLGSRKEQNNILRWKLEGLLGSYPDTSYTRGTGPGKTERVSHGGVNTRRSQTEEGLPLVISYQSSHTSLTSVLSKNPGNNIGVMLRSQHEVSGSLLDLREVSKGLIKHTALTTSTNMVSKGLLSALAPINPDLWPLSRSTYPLTGANSAQSLLGFHTLNSSLHGATLRVAAMNETVTRTEDGTFTHFLTWDAAQDDWCQQFQQKASLLQRGLRTLFPSGVAPPLTPLCIPCAWFCVRKEEDMPRVLQGIADAIKELMDTTHMKYGILAQTRKKI